MQKLNGRVIVGSLARRMFNPLHLGKAARLHWHRRMKGRHRDDAQLKLYAELLPGDFLHYGYFEDPDRAPEDISLNEIVAAQSRYAHLLLDQIVDRQAPVLDVGCGMGGLIRMLRERGDAAVALTPNRMQATYVRENYPGVEMQECKLEDADVERQRERFGTIVTSESLQYLKLDRALPVIESILKPGGRWVACDYFRRAGEAVAANGGGKRGAKHSGHAWDAFSQTLASRGWRIVHEQDITANVLPTLRFVHMWATRLGVPGLNFALGRLQRKQPGIHYLLEDGLALAQDLLRETIEIVDADVFAKQKKYLLLSMERTGG